MIGRRGREKERPCLLSRVPGTNDDICMLHDFYEASNPPDEIWEWRIKPTLHHVQPTGSAFEKCSSDPRKTKWRHGIFISDFVSSLSLEGMLAGLVIFCGWITPKWPLTLIGQNKLKNTNFTKHNTQILKSSNPHPRPAAVALTGYSITEFFLFPR